MPAPPDPQRSHYRILGVADRATTKEIRVAYLNLARALHPDRYTDSPTGEKRLAERRMREVNDSYTVLSDASQRTIYDYDLAHVSRSSASGSASAAAGQRRPTTGTSARPDPNQRPPKPPKSNPERFDADHSYRDDDGRIRHEAWMDDDVELSPVVAFLMQRGPLIVVLAIAAFLFIATAYAGTPKEPTRPVAPTTTCIDSSFGSGPSEPC